MRLGIGGAVPLIREFPPSRAPVARRRSANRGADVHLRAQGWTLRLPTGFRPVRELGPVTTVLSDGVTRIAVFRENVERIGVDLYVRYKSAPIRSGRDPVAIQRRRSYRVGGRLVYELRWTRPALCRVSGDAAHYATLDVVLSPSEILSLHVNTPDASWLDTYLPGLLEGGAQISEPDRSATPRFSADSGRAVPLAPAAAALLAQLRDGPQFWGVYEPGAPLLSDNLHALERKIGFTFPFLLIYTDLTTSNVGEQLRAGAALDRVVELTLHVPREAPAAPPTYFYELLDGAHDSALHAYAGQVRDFGAPLLFRLNNEMNGDWCQYCAYSTSQDAELFRAAWHHIFRVFADEGVSNALWVWNPHDRSFPDFRYNHPALYYPGNEFVDLVGMTGYSNGTYFPNEIWRSFDEIYAPMYGEYAAMFPDKPFVITEFACSAFGGDKAAWIRDALRRLPSYPRIRVAIWWNGIGDAGGNQSFRRYRLEEAEDFAAFKETIAPYRRGGR